MQTVKLLCKSWVEMDELCESETNQSSLREKVRANGERRRGVWYIIRHNCTEKVSLLPWKTFSAQWDRHSFFRLYKTVRKKKLPADKDLLSLFVSLIAKWNGEKSRPRLWSSSTWRRSERHGACWTALGSLRSLSSLLLRRFIKFPLRGLAESRAL